ncbi:hypothetical protein [Weissella paramesenteroides]|uniref:Uncharacterized protein n=1 Tax=Weissella paramesenteroides ATCC 33313 TaxID=585506 RepID=C5R826_WEIPA|nr:hypothetical protein [Weissella paramesenteroides]EER75610.1 hypothetical protein HMPREF0877_0121 [Weissella paramesenteroides ATCC 33313]
MTFDEGMDLLLENIPTRKTELRVLAIYVIDNFKLTYTPTIKMSKEEKALLLTQKETSSLTGFLDFILYSDELYGHLTDEELAQAWLHPECVKVVE